jgi:hypothetical protein
VGIEFDGKEERSFLDQLWRLRASWIGEVKETEPVREENPNSYSEELMAHGM